MQMMKAIKNNIVDKDTTLINVPESLFDIMLNYNMDIRQHLLNSNDIPKGVLK